MKGYGILRAKTKSKIYLRLDSGSLVESSLHPPGRGFGTFISLTLTKELFNIKYNVNDFTYWQPVGVGCLLLLEGSLKRRQNILHLKGTDGISTYCILWCGEDTIHQFCWFSLVCSLNN